MTDKPGSKAGVQKPHKRKKQKRAAGAASAASIAGAKPAASKADAPAPQPNTKPVRRDADDIDSIFAAKSIRHAAAAGQAGPSAKAAQPPQRHGKVSGPVDAAFASETCGQSSWWRARLVAQTSICWLRRKRQRPSLPRVPAQPSKAARTTSSQRGRSSPAGEPWMRGAVLHSMCCSHGGRLNEPLLAHRIDEEGLPIYSTEELNVGKGGSTGACPFDCGCCF